MSPGYLDLSAVSFALYEFINDKTDWNKAECLPQAQGQNDTPQQVQEEAAEEGSEVQQEAAEESPAQEKAKVIKEKCDKTDSCVKAKETFNNVCEDGKCDKMLDLIGNLLIKND